MFPTNSRDMLEYCNTHDISELIVPEFVFYSGPMMATSKDLFDTLETLCYKSMYYLPFKFIGFFRTLAQNATAKQLKGVMRDMTIDLDRYGEYYSHNDPDFNKDQFNNMCDSLKKYLSDVLYAVREYQHTNGVLESAVVNYAPIIPYEATVKKQTIDDESEFTAIISPRIDILKSYLNAYLKTPSEFASTACNILMSCVNGVMSFRHIAYNEIHSLYDCYKIIIESNSAAFLYWAYVCGCIYCKNRQTITENTAIADACQSIIGANGKLTDDDYARIFECLMPKNISIEELALEATLPDVDTIDSMPSVDAEPPIPEVNTTTMDMDRIRSILADMRYIDCNQIANQQFLEHVSSDITNYSYIGDNKQTIIAQVHGYNCIPYSDIADDHKLKVLMINSGDLEEDPKSVPIEEFIARFGTNAYKDKK